MKGLKCISKLSLFLSSVFLVLFCSVFLSKNASAASRNITNFSFNSNSSSPIVLHKSRDGQYSFDTLDDDFGNFYNKNFSLDTPEFTFNNPLTYGPSKSINIDFYLVAHSNAEYGIVAPFCPESTTYAGSSLVYSCKIETVSRDNLISSGYAYNIDTSTASLQFNSGVTYYFHIYLSFYASTDISVNSVRTYGRVLQFLDPNLNNSQPFTRWQLTFIFGWATDGTIVETTEDILKENQEKEEQQEQDLQNGQSDAEDGADSASAAAESGTDSLLGGLNTIFSALGSVSGSSCVLPNFSIYGLEFKNMDLCTFSVPPAITAITSVGMILGVGFLGYHLFHRIMNLYKELVG